MTTGTYGIEEPKLQYLDVSLSGAATTDEIDLKGGTLVGITIPELTGTSITITAATASGGTFRTVRDPFGLYGTEDTDVSLAIGTTSVGFYPLPPELTMGLRYIKLVSSASETATLTLAIRSVD